MKKQTKFEQFIYWLMGETAGDVTLSFWRWLWGISEPPEKSPLQIMEEYVEILEKSVAQLSDSATKVIKAYDQIYHLYCLKQKEAQEAEKQAQEATRKNDETAARLATTRLILIEKLLPQIAEKVETTKEIMQATQEKLLQKREDLERSRIEKQHLISLLNINQTLGSLNDNEQFINLTICSEEFEAAKQVVEQQHIQEVAFFESYTSFTETSLPSQDDIKIRLAQITTKSS